MSTAAKVDFAAIFEAFGRVRGSEARDIAESYWMNPTPEGRARYIERCVPFYRQRRDAPDGFPRAIMRTEVALHFNGPRNEHGRFDFRRELRNVQYPVLVMAGEEDPIMPIAFGETIVRSLPPRLVQFERFAGCGHVVHADDPVRAFRTMRDFITEV